MAQAGAPVRFHPEEGCTSPPPFAHRVNRRPWLAGGSPEAGRCSPPACLTPNLNAGRLHLLRKGLAPDVRRCPLGLYNSTGSLARRPAEAAPFGSGGCPGTGRLTAPCTPRWGRPSPAVASLGSRSPPAPEGRSSVVTFRFIEKASVRTLGCPTTPHLRWENGPHSLSRSLELGGDVGSLQPQPLPQERLLQTLKLEASASDPLLAGGRTPGETRPCGKELCALDTSCLCRSLTNGLPEEFPSLARSPLKPEPRHQVGTRVSYTGHGLCPEDTLSTHCSPVCRAAPGCIPGRALPMPSALPRPSGNSSMAPRIPQRQVRSCRWMPSGWPTPPFKSGLLAGVTLGLPIPWVFSVPNEAEIPPRPASLCPSGVRSQCPCKVPCDYAKEMTKSPWLPLQKSFWV